MENKEKDEIITRRDFFKKSAQKTLPILGIVALGGSLKSCMEIDNDDVKAKSGGGGGGGGGGCSNCGSSCVASCTSNCRSTCQANSLIKSGCGGGNGCKNACYSCSGTCSSGCTSSNR